MVKNYLLRRAVVMGLLMLVIGLALAACGDAASEAEPAEVETAEVASEAEEATDEAVEAATEEVEATDEAGIDEEQAIVASPPATCETIDIPDNELIPGPTADDWAKGPEMASITVIEYGDFQ